MEGFNELKKFLTFLMDNGRVVLYHYVFIQL